MTTKKSTLVEVFSIQSYADISTFLASDILANIDPKLEDVAKAPKRPAAIKENYLTSSDFYFIDQELADCINPITFTNSKGTQVILHHPVVKGLDFKALVQDNINITHLKSLLDSTPECVTYNLTDIDKEALIKAATTKANSVVKACCEAYGRILNTEYMESYQISVHTLFSDMDFGILAYYETDPSTLQPTKVLSANEYRLTYVAEKDADSFQKMGVRAETVTSRFEMYRNTEYLEVASNAMTKVVKTLDTYGKHIAVLSKCCKIVRDYKTGALKLTPAKKETQPVELPMGEVKDA